MTVEELLDFCLSKSGAIISYPFGSEPVCVKYREMLAVQIYSSKRFMITVRCEKDKGEADRLKYPEAVVRGYMCPQIQQPYFNTIYMDTDIPEAEIRRIINGSFDAVDVRKTNKKIKGS